MRTTSKSPANYNLGRNQLKSAPFDLEILGKVVGEVAKRAFQAKFRRWKEETASLSAPSSMMRHPLWHDLTLYKDSGLTLALEKLMSGDQSIQVFLLLEAFAGLDAAGFEVAGDTPAMTAAWLLWAKKSN